MAKEELADLTRSLRRRVLMSDEGSFTASPSSSRRTAPASADKTAALSKLAEQIHACRKCALGGQRLNAVPGVGSPEAKVMFIGEGPGFQEDHDGEPFVGRSGQLLDKILEAIGLSRKTNAYIANVVKCHPMKDPSNPEARGNDRPPTPEEAAACREWLDLQIRAISPKVIVTLGASAARALIGGEIAITKIRGQWREYQPADGGAPIKLLPTFHPAALLRDPNLKKDVWTDMKNLRKELEDA